MLTANVEYGDEPSIKIRFWNRYGVKVVLPSPNPFEFYLANGRLIYSPVSTQVLVEVDAGEVRDWEFSFEELGLSVDLDEDLVVKMSISHPRDELYVIIPSKKK